MTASKWEKIPTRRERVWALLQDLKWHTSAEICAEDVGGLGGGQRLRELRKAVRKGKFPAVADIVKRKAVAMQYEYRLVPIPVRNPVRSAKS